MSAVDFVEGTCGAIGRAARELGRVRVRRDKLTLELPLGGYVHGKLIDFWVRCMEEGRIGPPKPPDPYRTSA